MPVPMEIDDLHQTAVYWPVTGHDNRGQYVVGSPSELDVRWEWEHKETIDKNGNTIAIDATVVLNREVDVGSIMWLGELADWYGTGSAGDDSQVMQVINYKNIPDIKNRNTRFTYELMFFGDKVPD